MNGHRDLRLATALAAACALLAFISPLPALGLIFAAPLAFFLPGFAIVSAIFTRRRPAVPSLLALSLGLSLSTLALGALVLNYLPGGVRGFSWALLLLVVTAAACRIAAKRRPECGGAALPRPPLPNRGQAAYLGAAALVATAALVLAFTSLPADKAVGFTELWMRPYAGDGGTGVRVGVGSNEQGALAYRLRVDFGAQGPTVAKSFRLRPGEGLILRIPSPPGVDAPSPVSADLFRAGQPDRPYRRVSGWTPASSSP